MKVDMERFAAVAKRIKTPLTLAGLTIAVLYAIYKQILLLPVFDNIGSNATFIIIQNILDRLFWLAILTVVLGVGSYLITFFYSRRKLLSTSKVALIDASLDPRDSNYEQSIIRKKKTIHPKKGKRSDNA